MYVIILVIMAIHTVDRGWINKDDGLAFRPSHLYFKEPNRLWIDFALDVYIVQVMVASAVTYNMLYLLSTKNALMHTSRIEKTLHTTTP